MSVAWLAGRAGDEGEAVTERLDDLRVYTHRPVCVQKWRVVDNDTNGIYGVRMGKRTKQGERTTAVAYLRVSTEEQALGPEAQRAAIERWALANGVTVVAWFVDQGVSGGAPLDKRPSMLAAVDALEAHGAGALVVAKRDRLARDVVLAAMLESLVKRHGARIVSAAGEGGDDADDPSGMLMRRMVDAFAEYERALIRARTRAALAVKRGRGERTGAVPYGSRLGADARMLEPNADEQAVLDRVRALRAEGASLRAVVATLAAEGVTSRAGRPLTLTQVARIAA